MPKSPGVYLFLNEKGEILYVGKAKNLRERVSSYFAKYTILGTKTQILVSKIEKIKTIPARSEIEAFLLEAKYIKKYQPKYNIKLLDDKAYPMIKITIKDEYPKILTVRKVDNAQPERSIYFGPFPNGANALRLTLKTIRKIFPYQSTPNHPKKICLYYHLRLCPCPPVFKSKEFKKEYRKTIKHIVDFLNGKTKKVIRELSKERDLLGNKEEFEKANMLQNQIKAIELITGAFYKRGSDNVDPNFTEDLREKELSELMKILNENNVEVKDLFRIECYDISNISGENATGSLVVFTNGEKDSSWYRRFKIRLNNGPDDFAMLEEVLRRRLNHKEWPMPDLIIVDGGKGQISSAKKILDQMKLNIPLVGLAKREETIIVPQSRHSGLPGIPNFVEIILPKESSALKLVMRIRDEAHRFAITYHRKLRSKTFLP